MANQRFVDSLPCFITRVTDSDRILRGLWTPRWTPETGFVRIAPLPANDEVQVAVRFILATAMTTSTGLEGEQLLDSGESPV